MFTLNSLSGMNGDYNKHQQNKDKPKKANG